MDKHEESLGPIDVDLIEFTPLIESGDVAGELADQVTDVTATLVEGSVVGEHDTRELVEIVGEVVYEELNISANSAANSASL
jgi:hypothetical protein